MSICLFEVFDYSLVLAPCPPMLRVAFLCVFLSCYLHVCVFVTFFVLSAILFCFFFMAPCSFHGGFIEFVPQKGKKRFACSHFGGQYDSHYDYIMCRACVCSHDITCPECEAWDTVMWDRYDKSHDVG